MNDRSATHSRASSVFVAGPLADRAADQPDIAAPASRMTPWYKNAVFYCLDVETFCDADGDGVGDFLGLGRKLPYLAELGVDCVWLMPFYATANRDDGYDVTDHCAVDPRLGTLHDFDDFVRAAARLDIRVIVDLVVNHTSIDHPWFQAARSDPHSPRRAYYVWSADRPAHTRERLVFPGFQQESWSWDAQAGAWYHHRFYEHEPDLNMDCAEVREEIRRIVAFWLGRGISGYRVDAVPFIIERVGPDGRTSHEVFADLSALRRMSDAVNRDAVLIGEANVPPPAVSSYFGSGDRLHVMLDFLMAQRLFLALATHDAAPIVETLTGRPDIPTGCTWGEFIRNHDELDLARLSESERAQVIAAFGPRTDMQIYGRGLRRRLATMLGGDRNRIALAFSLQFTLPGCPVIFYGNEIGMGEELALPERLPVRTPMQWNDARGAGFSNAPEERFVRPLVRDEPFSAAYVNVDAQQQDPASLLNVVRGLIAARKQCLEIGVGSCTILPADPPVLMHRCDYGSDSVLFVHNLLNAPRTVRLEGADTREAAVVVASSGVERDPCRREIDLPAYGYAWLRL